jgi:hypothetical protein
MRLPKRDLIATVLVAVAGVLYLLWLLDVTLPGLGEVRATGLVILVLGFAASASAVVPGFAALMHGSRAYLAATALLGLVAFAGGLSMVLWASSAGLAVLVCAMVVLWAIATTHHLRLAQGQAGPSTTQLAEDRPAQHLTRR